ncbi:unnamed protein product [Mytilus coruscus]|uniref:Uncharacterized protein n=1 Tax=Mytilus coruscus TaxID=42192 RepID=A0A6J8CP23_MYTCO|nr:unnamed protein product [Mytilus coruscus]
MDFRRKVLKNNPALQGEFEIYENINELVNETVCKTSENVDKLKCLQRNCDICGVHNFKLPEEEKTDNLNMSNVQWERYEYVNLKRGSKSIRKLMLVKKSTKPFEMFSYFIQILRTFPYHQFSTSWQSDQLRSLLDNLPHNHCVTVNDYSESYRCFDKTEIQTGYFQKIEVSLHVTFLYRHAILEVDGIESSVDNPVIIKEEFFVISEDDKRDQYFTHYVKKSVSEYLHEISYTPKVMHEFNDGCATQYKSLHCFGHLATTFSDLGYDSIIRNFFETAHAKGAQDAAGGYIKREADFSVIRGRSSIQNGKDLFNFCNNNLQKPKSTGCKRRIFRYVETIPRNTTQHFKSIADIRKIHCVRTTNNSELMVSDLSCYTCDQCVSANYELCRNFRFRGNSRPVKIVREHSTENHTVENNNSGDTLLDLISKGTIIAVVAEDDDSDFDLMKTLGEPEILPTAVTDGWGISFPRGANVVKGYYYDIVSKRNFSYKLVPKRLAINYSVSARYILTESEITKSENSIKLNEEIHMNVLAALDYI